ncbi:MAG: hypothetical protein VKJ24_06785 [Synechococcales bacterium]|nr:hypothetical protein [Synechococcales bacterium]
MMNLDAQMKLLIQDAPEAGGTKQMVTAIAPAFYKLAQRLQFLQYYVAQTLNGDWIRLSLSHRTQSKVEKTVIYAFFSAEMITSGEVEGLSDVGKVEVLGVIDLLFRVWALNLCDSVIFFNDQSNSSQGLEIARAEIDRVIRETLEPPGNFA